MKHLRKYNEDLESDLAEIEYVKNCFVEFIDKGAQVEIGDDNEYFQIIINLPGVTYRGGQWNMDSYDTIKERIKYHEVSSEFYLDIDNCIDKVKLKYPDKEYDFETEQENNDEDGYFEAYLMITYNLDD
jgi:hypothetical protein